MLKKEQKVVSSFRIDKEVLKSAKIICIEKGTTIGKEIEKFLIKLIKK